MTPHPPKAIINTQHGDAEIAIQHDQQNLSLHCFIPPCGGAGLFAVFECSTGIADAIDGMRQVIDLGPYESNQNLTDHFNIKDCTVVGSGSSAADHVRQNMAALVGSPLKGLH